MIYLSHVIDLVLVGIIVVTRGVTRAHQNKKRDSHQGALAGRVEANKDASQSMPPLAAHLPFSFAVASLLESFAIPRRNSTVP